MAERKLTLRVLGTSALSSSPSHDFATSILNRHVSGAFGSDPPIIPVRSSLPYEGAVAEARPEKSPAGADIDLEQAIAGLPAGARRVFVLYQIEGHRHEEIAKMTGTAVGTSKAQLHRARRLLREALER